MAVKSMDIVPNDKGVDEVINPGKPKTEADFPDVENEPKTEAHNGSKVPDGKGGAVDAK